MAKNHPVSYFEGSAYSFRFKIDNRHPQLSAEERDRIRLSWDEARKVDPHLTAGGIYCANGVNIQNHEVRVNFNETTYDIYRYFRGQGTAKQGVYTMGDATALYDETLDKYLFAVRGGSVSFDKGTFSFPSGGVVSTSEESIDESRFMDYVARHAHQETEEELLFTKITGEKFLGAYVEKPTHKLEFLFFALVGGECSVKNDENTHLVYVERGRVREFYNDNRGNFENSADKHLNYWSDHFDRGVLN